MKAYRVEGQFSQALFYVGYKKDVDATLTSFFQKHPYGVEPSKRVPEQLSCSFKKGSHNQHSLLQQSSQSGEPVVSSTRKHLSVYLMMYDLGLDHYNEFQAELRQKFQFKISAYPDAMSLHLGMVESREESLKFIKKIEKYGEAEFTANLLRLSEELTETMEYELVKLFLEEKLLLTKEEAFDWLQKSRVNNFECLFGFKDLPYSQKRYFRTTLQNLSVLESLYGKEGSKEKKKSAQKRLLSQDLVGQMEG